MSGQIKTRFLIISDTHGLSLPVVKDLRADVAIHRGDRTDSSTLPEFKTSLGLLKSIKAPLKLVIAGNHDFSLDYAAFSAFISSAWPPLDPEDEERLYEERGEVGDLFESALEDGVMFLDEGNHSFDLKNGARLKVYASPFTPSAGNMGFIYHPTRKHDFAIEEGTDVVVTHGPPLGVFDMTDEKKRAGYSCLFGAVARARPRMHCFGHIHEGWGARLVGWKDFGEDDESEPSHFRDIDHGNSTLISSLALLRRDGGKTEGYFQTSHCGGDEAPLEEKKLTLFVNAALKGDVEELTQLPWLVDIELPRKSTD